MIKHMLIFLTLWRVTSLKIDSIMHEVNNPNKNAVSEHFFNKLACLRIDR